MRRLLQQQQLMTATTHTPHTSPNQSRTHTHTHRHTCEGNTVEGREGEKAHAKLLTLTCRNKRAAHSLQSKAKNMKLAYNFRRCRHFCFVHQLTDKWQNGMNETASLPHEFWSNGTHTHRNAYIRTKEHTHRNTHARVYTNHVSIKFKCT